MALLNAPQFQRRLFHFIDDEVPKNLMRRQIEIAVHLLERLQTKTPIDTGFAISNWRMNVDTIPSGTLGTYRKAAERKLPYKANDPYRFKRKPLGPLQARSRDKLIDTAFNRGQEFNSTEWKKIGHTVYVFNNVKYMQVLEQGHSKQAPRGWIKITIEETKVWMKSKGW